MNHQQGLTANNEEQEQSCGSSSSSSNAFDPERFRILHRALTVGDDPSSDSVIQLRIKEKCGNDDDDTDDALSQNLSVESEHHDGDDDGSSFVKIKSSDLVHPSEEDHDDVEDQDRREGTSCTPPAHNLPNLDTTVDSYGDGGQEEEEVLSSLLHRQHGYDVHHNKCPYSDQRHSCSRSTTVGPLSSAQPATLDALAELGRKHWSKSATTATPFNASSHSVIDTEALEDAPPLHYHDCISRKVTDAWRLLFGTTPDSRLSSVKEDTAINLIHRARDLVSAASSSESSHDRNGRPSLVKLSPSNMSSSTASPNEVDDASISSQQESSHGMGDLLELGLTFFMASTNMSQDDGIVPAIPSGSRKQERTRTTAATCAAEGNDGVDKLVDDRHFDKDSRSKCSAKKIESEASGFCGGALVLFLVAALLFFQYPHLFHVFKIRQSGQFLALPGSTFPSAQEKCYVFASLFEEHVVVAASQNVSLPCLVDLELEQAVTLVDIQETQPPVGGVDESRAFPSLQVFESKPDQCGIWSSDNIDDDDVNASSVQSTGSNDNTEAVAPEGKVKLGLLEHGGVVRVTDQCAEIPYSLAYPFFVEENDEVDESMAENGLSDDKLLVLQEPMAWLYTKEEVSRVCLVQESIDQMQNLIAPSLASATRLNEKELMIDSTDRDYTQEKMLDDVEDRQEPVNWCHKEEGFWNEGSTRDPYSEDDGEILDFLGPVAQLEEGEVAKKEATGYQFRDESHYFSLFQESSVRTPFEDVGVTNSDEEAVRKQDSYLEEVAPLSPRVGLLENREFSETADGDDHKLRRSVFHHIRSLLGRKKTRGREQQSSTVQLDSAASASSPDQSTSGRSGLDEGFSGVPPSELARNFIIW